jgi:hypothetical protein
MTHRFLPHICAGAVLLLAPTARAADAQVFFATPGPDASTQIQVSWHASVTGTRLAYTRKSDVGTVGPSFVDCGAPGLDATFSGESFYRCKAELDGLSSDTEYVLRVEASSHTPERELKTALGRGSFSFLWMSDIHAYPSIPSRVDKADDLAARAVQIAGNLAFVLVTGDTTAHGANYTHWQELDRSSFANSYMLAVTPGNHDYYDSSANTIDDRFFNAVFANPANGASEVPNSTYWFRYNNALFISLNTEARTTAAVDAQKAWLREVVTNNPAQYIIVFLHRTFFLGSESSSNNVVRKSSTYTAYGALLEELGVDLALGGDDHSYVRTKEISNGEVAAAGHGTTYLSGTQIGDRGVAVASGLGTYGAQVYGGTDVSSASVITISDTSIDGVLFEADGTVHDSYSIAAHRAAPADPFDKDAYANAFAARVDPPGLTEGILGFSDQGYDRVRTIEVNDAVVPATVYASFTPVAGMTEATLSPLVPGLTYEMNVHILFKDGDTRDASVGLVNKLSPGTYADLRLESSQDSVFLTWQNDLVPEQISRIVVSANGAWQQELPAGADEVEVTPGLHEGANTVGFAVIDRYEDEIFNETLAYEFAPEALDGGGGGGGAESQRWVSNNEPDGCACGLVSSGSPGWARGYALLLAGMVLSGGLVRSRARR